MRNKLLILSILLIAISANLSASTVSTITAFDSGLLSVKAGFNSDWLYGSRGDALRMGGSQSTLDFQPSFTSYNPAVLAFLPYATASMALAPSSILSTDFVGLFVGKGYLNDQIKKVINENMGKTFENVTKTASTTLAISSLDVNVAQSINFTGFEIMVPFAKGQAAFGYARENKTSMDLSIMLPALTVKLTYTAQSVDVDVDLLLNAFINFKTDNIVTSFGVGRKLTPEWGIGCVAEHFDSRFVLDGRAEINGTATLASIPAEYNTDAAHSLEQRAYANLVGEAWGLRFGTSYHFLNNAIELGADVSVQPQINYNGKPEILYHTLSDSIDLLDYTKTVAHTIDEANGTLKMKLPSFARFTFGWKYGMAGNFNYTHYFDSYSLKFNTDTDNIEMHLAMMDAVRLGLNFGVFQIGGGAIYSKTYIKTNGEQSNLKWFIIPVLSTGVVIPFGDYLKYEMEILAFPLPILKTAITYNFI